MTSQPGFTVDVDQNPYLAAGMRDVSAIVTVTAGQDGAGQAANTTGSAEIIIIDCSGSMDANGKMAQARAATEAAIDLISDGTLFAVIAGTAVAHVIYPADGTLAVANPGSRELAKRSVRSLKAHGGTAIGKWLTQAHRVFQSAPAAALRHAILLTDGENQHETPEELAAAISACEGTFRCDCRGVGTSWKVSELRRISTALLGTVDIVPEPAGLAADFAELMRGAMSKRLADVVLRVWTPMTASVQFVKQVAPSLADLTGRRAPSGAQAGDYPTGAWAPGESRDYHIGVLVTAADVGRDMLAARVSLVARPQSAEGEQVLGQGLVRALWTDDEALSTRINAGVAHYTGQAELAAAIADGLEASQRDDEETATTRLGRAVALAHQAGNEEVANLLAKVVDVIDPVTGTVRLKKTVAAADEMALDTRSTKTVRVAKGASDANLPGRT